MNVLDLFSGIGGFSLGLERAGMRTVAFCEINERCRQVLQNRWPNVPRYDDVRTLTAARLRADGIAPEVICGGFPCQDLSSAGKQAGIRAERSGLWSQYARIIDEVRPRFVIVENVSALLSGPSERPGEWFGVVLGDLATLGFDAEWHCIPASAVGARHRRDRVWIVAYPRSSERGAVGSPRQRLAWSDCLSQWQEGPGGLGASGETLADANGAGLSVRVESALGSPTGHAQLERQDRTGREWWAVEPNVGRVAHGIPGRVDRLRSLGNSVVPQIPEIIGRAIMKSNQAANAQERSSPWTTLL